MHLSDRSERTPFLDRQLQDRAILKWPNVSPPELSEVASEDQLVNLIARKSGRTAVEVAPVVHDWLERKGISRS